MKNVNRNKKVDHKLRLYKHSLNSYDKGSVNLNRDVIIWGDNIMWKRGEVTNFKKQRRVCLSDHPYAGLKRSSNKML